MKRNELIRQITESDCLLHRHGSKHDIYMNPATGQKQPVPGHNEIDDTLVKHIKKHLGIKK
jgi:mRNA interferase HicA